MSRGVNVRRAIPEDADVIAMIHVRAWQAAYRGLVPDAFLDTISVPERCEVWRRALEQEISTVWIAEDGERPLGWVSVGRSRDPDALRSTGELWAIYVDPHEWRSGVGRVLWTRGLDDLASMGFGRVTLWVFRENAGARRFYEALGFAEDPGHEKVVDRGGVSLVEIRLTRGIAGTDAHGMVTRRGQPRPDTPGASE